MNIWAEKYRPETVEELIFPEKEKTQIRKWLSDGEIPHLGIFGLTAGTGKCHDKDEEIEIWVDDETFDKYFG